MATDYGALAEGLQRGFSIGMSFIDMENKKKQQDIENRRAKDELEMRKAEAQNRELWRETDLRLQVIGAIKDPVRQAGAFKKLGAEHGFDIDVGDPAFIAGIIKDSTSILATINKPGATPKTIEIGRSQIESMWQSANTQEEITALAPAYTAAFESTLSEKAIADEEAKIDAFEKTFGRKPNEN